MEHLSKLAHNCTNRTDSDIIQETNGLVHLLQCFDVYGQAVCHYAHPTVSTRLQVALLDYRLRLAELHVHYKFDSICIYHTIMSSFVTIRILSG